MHNVHNFCVAVIVTYNLIKPLFRMQPKKYFNQSLCRMYIMLGFKPVSITDLCDPLTMQDSNLGVTHIN